MNHLYKFPAPESQFQTIAVGTGSFADDLYQNGVGLFLVASLLGGIAWAITYGGLVNRLMERSPADDRPAYMAFHNLALNLGILSGSLAGPLLSEWVGLRPALFVVVGLRLLAGVLLAAWA